MVSVCMYVGRRGGFKLYVISIIPWEKEGYYYEKTNFYTDMILDFEDKLSSLLTLTIAKRLLQPFTFVGMLLNFWSNASEILWAGSVEIISTLSLVWASWRAILQLKKKRKGYCCVKLNSTQSYLLDTVCLKEQWCQIILFKDSLI